MLDHLKYPVITFIVGIIITMAGALLVALTVEGGSFLVGTGLMVQAISLVMIVVVLIRKRR
jgi:hypothetical protein